MNLNKHKEKLYFFLFFLILLFVFFNSFKIGFFADDYFYLKISKIGNLSQFINFFSPQKSYFYRPLTSEVFYFFYHLTHSIFFLHLIVFAVYFLGLIFLFRIINKLFRDTRLSFLFIFLYAVNFTHVFQLYAINTFQEIALFAFLTISFYFYIYNKKAASLGFFIFALLSKEAALIFPLWLLLFETFFLKKNSTKSIKNIFIFVIASVFFIFIYKNGAFSAMKLNNYSPVLSIRLMTNNFIWYLLWSLGFPSFLPDYLRTFFSMPLDSFWLKFGQPDFVIYFFSMIFYNLAILTELLIYFFSNSLKKIIKTVFFILASFAVFITPFIFFIHKWMVRLTIPLIFIIFFQSWILFWLIKNKKRGWRFFSVATIIFYLIFNYFGVKVHEDTSTYLLETKIYNNVRQYINIHKDEILKYRTIFFKDTTYDLPKGWNGSEKLKMSLGDQNFLDHFFPNNNVYAIYGFENKKIPKESYVIESNIFLK